MRRQSLVNRETDGTFIRTLYAASLYPRLVATLNEAPCIFISTIGGGTQ